MANIVLGIVGDTTDIYAKLNKLRTDVEKFKVPPVKFDIQGDAKLLNAFARANNSAAAYQKALNAANRAEEKKQQSAKKTAEAVNYLNTVAAKYDATLKESAASARRYSASLQSQIRTEQEEKRATEGLISTYNVIDRAIHEREAASRAFSQALRQQMREEKEGEKATKGFGEEQKRSASSIASLASGLHSLGDAYAKLWSRITSTITRRLINQAFTALRTTIKDTLNVMKEVDTQLINIQKVSGKTSEEIAAIGERAYDTAAKYGVAVEDYLSAVYAFQKAGLGESAESLAELATKTMLVGDTTSAVAEKFLISANAAWELHGNIDELNKVIDQADYINNNYATTLDKIAAGLPIVASVAANAGMTYSETMAALGTIQSITQESGTKSATALRALILNIEKEAGTYLTDEGEEFEVTEESIKGLQGLLEKYAKTEMDAAKAAGELINPMTAIKALFEGMKNSDVNDIELFNLLSAMGGKLRTNQLTALVKNFDMFDDMLVQLAGSAGTADKEIELMLGSWEKKTQILKDRWQQFIAKLVSTDEIKGFIDDITEFVTNLDADKIGAAIKDTLYPIIDFLKSVDWAEAAKNLSDTFGKIMAIAKGTTIAATLGAVIGGLEKIFKLVKAIGGLLGIGGAAALGAGIPLAGLGVMLGSIAVGAVEYQSKIDRATSATKKFVDVLNDSKAAYKENIDSIEQTSVSAELYIQKLQDLESQGTLTTEQQGEYHRYLERLTQIMPELAELIDLENDKILGGIPALEERAKAWEQDAKAAAYNAMIQEQSAALIEAQVQQSINERKYNAAHAIAEDYRSRIEELQSQLDALADPRGKDFQEHWRLVDEITALNNNEDYKQALRDENLYGEALEQSNKLLADRKAELDEITSAIQAIQEEEAAAAEAAAAEEEAEAERQDRLDKRAEARRSQFSTPTEATQATQAATQATQEATQAENEYAEAATNSGQAATQAATVTKESAQDTVKELENVKKALDAIPEERGITLTPHFDNALAAIQRYCHFLDYLKENYSSTLTSTITHDDREHGKFTQETFSGANGIPARAVGDSNFPGGPTLVNELGPELISENGRAYIAGGGRPTVVNLSSGAIVIPADQTREALKGGMPRYGRAGIFVGDFTNQSGNPSLSGVDTNLGIRVTTSNKTGRGTTASELLGSRGVGSGKGGSGSGTTTARITFDFKDLESKLSDALKLYDAQAKLAENEGDYAKMAEMYEKSQEAIKDLVDKYRQAGYADDSIEIVTLLNKNYDYAKKQLDLYEDKWDDLIKALEADTDATKALKELEDKRLALEEAVAAYENAQKQRTVRMYNAATGQWEWIADDKKIQSAKDKVTSAEESYNDAVKKQAIEELKKMKESVTDLSDVVLGPALSAVVTMSETSDEFQAFARALDAVFGVGSFLQSTEGTTKALSTVDSHDINYSFGGVSLTEEQAASMTLAQLAQMLQVLKLT